MSTIEFSSGEMRGEYCSPSSTVVIISVRQILMTSGGRDGDNENTEEEDLF